MVELVHFIAGSMKGKRPEWRLTVKRTGLDRSGMRKSLRMAAIHFRTLGNRLSYVIKETTTNTEWF